MRINERFDRLESEPVQDQWEHILHLAEDESASRADPRGAGSQKRWTPTFVVVVGAGLLVVAIALAALLPLARRGLPAGAPGIFLPTQTLSHDTWATAAFPTRLVEESGCIFGARHTLIVWPKGYSTSTDSRGALQVVNEDGAPVANMNEPVTLGGSGGGGKGVTAQAEKVIGRPLPAACIAEQYFYTSGLEPLADASPSATLPVTSNIVRINCTNSGTRVLTPTAVPQPDGYHFHIEHTPDVGSVDMSPSGRGGNVSIGLDHGTETNRVVPAGLGSYLVKCSPADESALASGEGSQPLVLADPAGLYHSRTLDCDTHSRFFSNGGKNSGLSPEQSIQKGVSGIRASDTVDWAGFPKKPTIWGYRVVRSGKTIALIRPSGGFFSGEACRSSGIGE